MALKNGWITVRHIKARNSAGSVSLSLFLRSRQNARHGLGTCLRREFQGDEEAFGDLAGMCTEELYYQTSLLTFTDLTTLLVVCCIEFCFKFRIGCSALEPLFKSMLSCYALDVGSKMGCPITS